MKQQSSGAAKQREVKKATQPVEVPGAVLATRPFEAPGAALMASLTDQEASLPATDVVRPVVQPPGPATQPAPVSKQSTTSLSGSVAPVEDQFSNRASSVADEGQISDMESIGPDRDGLLEVDQELTAQQTYRETLRGVRSFTAWNDIPEFDSSSSSQDGNQFTGSRGSHTGKVSVKATNGCAGNLRNSI